MGKKGEQNWSRDQREAREIARNFKEIKQVMKEEADRRALDGCHPHDLRHTQ